MKKLILLAIISISIKANAQNVGVVTTTPAAKLDVKAPVAIFVYIRFE